MKNRSYSDNITLDISKPVISNVSDTPDPFNPLTGGKTTIGFKVSDNLSPTSDITVKIYNASSVMVKTINKAGVSSPASGTATSVIWPGKDNTGAIVPAGTYTYKIQARDQALNYSIIQSGTVTVQ